MTRFLKSVTILALVATTASTATALTALDAQIDINSISLFESDANIATSKIVPHSISHNTPIGLARIDKGRFIATPYREADDWNALNQTLSQNLISLKPAAHLKAVPEIDENGQDTENKIDEIRLAAVDSGLPYILIYGIFDDAHFASFGGKALRETGLTVKVGCESWQRGDAKALLVDSYTGEVLDAVTTWAPDMPALTKDVEEMISKLTVQNISP